MIVLIQSNNDKFNVGKPIKTTKAALVVVRLVHTIYINLYSRKRKTSRAWWLKVKTVHKQKTPDRFWKLRHLHCLWNVDHLPVEAEDQRTATVCKKSLDFGVIIVVLRAGEILGEIFSTFFRYEIALTRSHESRFHFTCFEKQQTLKRWAITFLYAEAKKELKCK